jgi:hypothetical protein
MFNVYPTSGANKDLTAFALTLCSDTSGVNNQITVPQGVFHVFVTVQGAQGGGGGSYYAAYYAAPNVNSLVYKQGGDGAMGARQSIFLDVNPGDILSWAYSNGGAAGINGYVKTGSTVGTIIGTNGGAGGVTTFSKNGSVILTASGGQGGYAAVGSTLDGGDGVPASNPTFYKYQPNISYSRGGGTAGNAMAIVPYISYPGTSYEITTTVYSGGGGKVYQTGTGVNGPTWVEAAPRPGQRGGIIICF